LHAVWSCITVAPSCGEGYIADERFAALSVSTLYSTRRLERSAASLP
jgi:hypothetical protein